MSPDTLSKIVTAFAISTLALLVAFNLGRAAVLAKARQCYTTHSFTVPFKGTIN